MNVSKRVSGLVAIGAALFLFAGAQGCDGEVTCTDCGPGGGGSGGSGASGGSGGNGGNGGNGGSGAGTTTSSETESTTASTTSSSTTTQTSTQNVDPTTIEGICQKACACEPEACGPGGNDISDCVEGFQVIQMDAIDAGCTAELAAAIACYDQQLVCVNGELEFEGCLPLIDQFEECVDGPQPDPTECTEIIDQVLAKYQSCGIDVEPSEDPPPPCDDELLEQLQCIAPCTLNAPCGVFDGTAPQPQMDAYFACIESCQ